MRPQFCVFWRNSSLNNLYLWFIAKLNEFHLLSRAQKKLWRWSPSQSVLLTDISIKLLPEPNLIVRIVKNRPNVEGGCTNIFFEFLLVKVPALPYAYYLRRWSFVLQHYCWKTSIVVWNSKRIGSDQTNRVLSCSNNEVNWCTRRWCSSSWFPDNVLQLKDIKDMKQFNGSRITFSST